MHKRSLFVTVAGSALLFALTLAGLSGIGVRVAAQTAPDEAATTDIAAEKAAAYDAFVGTLASELGVADAAQVDAAIRTALKQAVDDRLAAGEISVEAAAARKAVIDVTESPLMLGVGFEGRFPGGHGPMRGEGHGPRPGDRDGGFDGRDERPVGGELPAEAAPADEAPANQDSSPVDETPTA
jgi:hypothetical protein